GIGEGVEFRGVLLRSWTAMWKLVPPKPKLDTPARRGRSGALIHGRAWLFRYSGLAERSSRGSGRDTLMVGGSTLWCRASTVLSKIGRASGGGRGQAAG